MAVLQPSEYDAMYFEGSSQVYTHNAGYSDYHRINFPSKGHFVPIEDSTGYYLYDLIKRFNIILNGRFVGKNVLVIACAYGWEVKMLRDLGVNAYGIDVSQYAINQANSTLADRPEITANDDIVPYLSVADARTIMPTYRKNEWDYIFSNQFLECMSDADLTTLIPAMNNACKNEQCHLTRSNSDPTFYNSKPLSEWVQLPFAVGTIFIDGVDLDNYVTKIN